MQEAEGNVARSTVASTVYCGVRIVVCIEAFHWYTFCWQRKTKARVSSYHINQPPPPEQNAYVCAPVHFRFSRGRGEHSGGDTRECVPLNSLYSMLPLSRLA